MKTEFIHFVIKSPSILFLIFLVFVCLYEGVRFSYDVAFHTHHRFDDIAAVVALGDVHVSISDAEREEASRSAAATTTFTRTATTDENGVVHYVIQDGDIELIQDMRRHAVADVDSDPSHPARNTVILAIANSGNLELLQNWMQSMTQSGHTDYYILSFDENLVSTLQNDPNFTGGAALVPDHWHAHDAVNWSDHATNEEDIENYDAKIAEQPHHWATQGYYKLTRARTHIVRLLLSHGLSILLTDVDTVWRSPKTINYVRDFMISRPHVEVAFALDAMDGTHLALGRAHTSTAFYFAKSTERVIGLFDEGLRQQEGNLNMHDREAMQEALAASPQSTEFVGYFDHLLIMNGKDYFQRKVHVNYGIEPLVVHANWIVGPEMKKSALVEAGLWYL